MTEPARPDIPGPPVRTMLTGGIFLILLTAALRLGAGMLIPIAIAALLTLLLDPLVRMFHRIGLPTGIAAALVVFGTLGVVGTGAALLVEPATEWVQAAPRTVVQVRARIRRMFRPLQETAQKMDQATDPATPGAPPTVQIKEPGVLERLRGSTPWIIATAGTVVFLTYFLLAMLPAFRKKLARLIGTRTGARSIEAVLTEIELQMSRYMLLSTIIGAGVGLATWGLLAAVGLPNSLLWGVLAFFLNFIPYAGAFVAVALIGAAALVSIDGTGRVLAAVGGCAAIHIVAGNFVTPHLLGRHLPLNPVAIFLSLLYWGWVWGPAGTLLAVPITVMLQVIFAHIETLRPLAVLLD